MDSILTYTHKVEPGPEDPATVEMTVTPQIEKLMQGDPFFLEIEMLQGVRETRPEGMTYYHFTISDPDKIKMVKAFALYMLGGCTIPNPS